MVDIKTLCSIAIIIIAIVMLFRRMEVRLVLLLASFLLYALAGQPVKMLENLVAELTKGRTLIPICASMGFAYVLNATECDKHLVQLLLRPLRSPVAHVLLIPGCIFVGYVVNIAIVSQTAAVAIVGSIAVPLLLQRGFSPVTIGSLLLLGTSMGGELLNFGAVEIRKLYELTGISTGTLVQRSMPLNVLACTTALLVYWQIAVLKERKHRALSTSGSAEDMLHDPTTNFHPPVAETSQFVINPIKAAVPFVPLLLLFGAMKLQRMRLTDSSHELETILAAMLIGSLAASLSSPKKTGKMASVFFEGMGFAFARVISVTAIAATFAEAIKASGLIDSMVHGLSGHPTSALLASLVLPCGLAVLSGSGAGAATSMMNTLIPYHAAMQLDPGQMGILTAMGSHFGRTMSPAAAVAILCATLVSAKGATDREIGTMTLSLTKRVLLPLFAGGIVLFIAASLGLGR